MKNPTLVRLVAVIGAMVALPIVALAPALLASLSLTHELAETDEESGYAAKIDVTDIDQNGTVMYTVSPPKGAPTDPKIDFPSILEDSDIIRLTITDRGTERRFSDELTEYECNFTLYLGDDDKWDEKTGAYTGYLRIRDDEIRDPAWNHDSRCGIVITYDHESK